METCTRTPALLDVEAAAYMLAISTRTIWRLLEQGSFPQPVRIGRATRWRTSDVERFVDELTNRTK